MISSMTAFARHQGQGDWGQAVWEIRSVNHRYLEIGVRMPEAVRSLEAAVRERVGACLSRGKVDCALRYDPTSAATLEITINRALVQELAKISREVDGLIYNPAPVSSLDLLRWPGALEIATPDPEQVAGPLLGLLDQCLAALGDTRRREGEKLAAHIGQRCEAAHAQVVRLRGQIPEILAALKQRLMARAQELDSSMDPGRLEQEMLIIAQRLDVAEELDRLDTHLQEVERLLRRPEPVGRRLDFLMQEMNREANTLGSKSGNADTTSAAVELKVLIEQMREQVQNIE